MKSIFVIILSIILLLIGCKESDNLPKETCEQIIEGEYTGRYLNYTRTNPPVLEIDLPVTATVTFLNTNEVEIITNVLPTFKGEIGNKLGNRTFIDITTEDFDSLSIFKSLMYRDKDSKNLVAEFEFFDRDGEFKERLLTLEEK